MELNDIAPAFVTAEGPEGLSLVLNNLLEKAKTDPQFKAARHSILYQLGNQRSLIKVDMSEQPFQFYYNDLLGRPITLTVKETIARFLWEKCGEKEQFFKEFQGE